MPMCVSGARRATCYNPQQREYALTVGEKMRAQHFSLVCYNSDITDIIVILLASSLVANCATIQFTCNLHTWLALINPAKKEGIYI